MAVEIATAYVSITPSMRGFSAKLAEELGGPLQQQSKEQGEKSGSGFAASFKGALAGLATGLLATQVLDFAKGSITAASDLGETVSKSATIFGEASGEVRDWAAGAAKGFGQTEQGALDAAATFGNLFSQLGIGSDQAATMSTRMVELASDFASFNNANPADVIEAQTAAFRGEYDALQRFVPTINAATVEQKALAMTGKTVTSELTAQEKALAVNALMMENAGAAAGDFDKTSGSLANQQRILSSQVGDLQARLGAQLLPVLSTLAGVLIDTVLPAVESAGEFFGGLPGPVQAVVAGLSVFAVVGGGAAIAAGKVAAGVSSVVGAARQAGTAISSAASGASRLASGLMSGVQSLVSFGRAAATGAANMARQTAAFVAQRVAALAAAVAQKAMAAAQWLLNVAMSANPIGLVVAGIAALVAGAVLAYRHFEPFRAVVDALGRALRDGLGAALEWVTGTLWPAVLGFFAAIPGKVGEVVAFFTGLPGVILGAIGDAASWLADKGVDIVTGLVGGYLSVLDTVTSTIGALAGQVVAWAGDAGSFLVQKGKDVVTGLLSGYLSLLGSISSTLGQLAGQVVAWAGNAAGWLVQVGRNIVQGAINGFNSWLGFLTGTVSGIAGAVMGAVSGAASWLYNAGRDVIAGFIAGIRSMAGAAAGAARDAVGGAISAARKVLQLGSPSKVFIAMGMDVGRGFEIGIERSWPDVPVAVPSLGRATVPAAVSPPGPALAFQASQFDAPAFTSNNQQPVNLYLDGRQVASSIDSYRRSRR